jgi:hypothetical protein
MPDDRRVYFQNLRWAETDPAHLINRDAERAELYRPLEGFITAPPDPRRRLCMAVVGDKGVGKSIVTLSVLQRLREEHSGQVVIVSVDCRRRRGWREVLAGVAEGLRDELYELSQARVPVPAYGFDGASLLRDLAHLDQVKEEQLHEHINTHTSKGRLGGALELRKLFQMELSVELTQVTKSRSAVVGARSLDDERVNRLLIGLLTDLNRDGLRVVVFIDNLDELDHRYTTDAARDQVRHEVEGLLKLSDAPIALVVNARTYFAGALGREKDATLRLKPLPPAELARVVARRLDFEPPDIQRQMAAADVQAELAWLCEVSGSPLELLFHVNHRAKAGSLLPDARAEGVREELDGCFPSFSRAQMERLVRCFQGEPVQDRAAIEGALGRETLVKEAMKQQLILPVDFWDPVEFTLDPRLFPLRALLGA